MSDIITNFPVNFKSIVLDVSEGLQDQTHTYMHTDEHPAYFITNLYFNFLGSKDLVLEKLSNLTIISKELREP